MIEGIFERLYQVGGPTQASRKGLGLGLYICKELVTRQGGTIWVERQPQGGSTFSFTVPVLSLNELIAPLLRDEKWPAESVALVMVEMCVRDAWPSKEAQEAWAHDARSVIQSCVLPDLDVVLPRMNSAGEGERVFVAAFADENGASVLANRIREQFDRAPQLKQLGRALSVSYSMVQPVPREVGASVEKIVTSMATNLERAIKSQGSVEAVYDG
jgi:hypothetical protein